MRRGTARRAPSSSGPGGVWATTRPRGPVTPRRAPNSGRSSPRAVNTTQRLFVSVDPPNAVVEDLGTLVDSLLVARHNTPGRSTRLQDRSRWHVTLAFLASVPVDRADAVCVAVDAAAKRALAPMRLRLA